MAHRLVIVAVAATICAVPSVVSAWGADHRGAVGSAHASQWPKGLRELANRPDRVHGYFVNWADVFFYSGDTAAFNDFLSSYSKLENTVLEIVLHPGPKKARSPWDKANRDIPVDWSLYISLFAREQLERLKANQPTSGRFTTRIDLYVGRSIGLEGLQVPPNVEVGSGGELEDFVAKHQQKHAVQEKK